MICGISYDITPGDYLPTKSLDKHPGSSAIWCLIGRKSKSFDYGTERFNFSHRLLSSREVLPLDSRQRSTCPVVNGVTSFLFKSTIVPSFRMSRYYNPCVGVIENMYGCRICVNNVDDESSRGSEFEMV